MITLTTIEQNNLNSSVRTITARVDVYKSSTLAYSFAHNNRLIKFDVQRVGDESKFFGFGIIHRLNFHLIDINREVNVQAGDEVRVTLGSTAPFPYFYVSEVHRDENTNELSITAYDKLYGASEVQVKFLQLETPYTILGFTEACKTLLGISQLNVLVNDAFDTVYPDGANFDGEETIREALDRVAEATQTIYFLNYQNKLTFKRLNKDGSAVFNIDKSKIFTYSTKTNRRLVGLASITELGDNVESNNGQTGTVQYVRDNPFWDIREDVGELVTAAFQRVNGLTIGQFDISWRGNYALEIGDKISYVCKDGGAANSYVLNDTVEYNGSLSEKTQWNYNNDESETDTNSANLGDVLRKTFARVDKANKQITLLASENTEIKDNMAQIRLDTQSINMNVTEIKNNAQGLQADIDVLTHRVDTSISSTEVEIMIQTELNDGVDKVTTSTGFTFDENGLNISKENSEMNTLITEDGMTVYKDNQAVLTANNQGVDAVNLHATTYLIIGTNSRFEDFDGNRTGCFYVGQS